MAEVYWPICGTRWGEDRLQGRLRRFYSSVRVWDLWWRDCEYYFKILLGQGLMFVVLQYRGELSRLAVGLLGDDDIRGSRHHTCSVVHARDVRTSDPPSQGTLFYRSLN